MSQILAGNDWVTLGDEYDLLNAACDVGDVDDVTTTSDDLLKNNTHTLHKYLYYGNLQNFKTTM